VYFVSILSAPFLVHLHMQFLYNQTKVITVILDIEISYW